MMLLVEVCLFGILLLSQSALGTDVVPIVETLIEGLAKSYFRSIQGHCGILNVNTDLTLNIPAYNIQLAKIREVKFAEHLDKNEKCAIGIVGVEKNVSLNQLTSLIERTFLYTALFINGKKEMRTTFIAQKFPYLIATEMGEASVEVIAVCPNGLLYSNELLKNGVPIKNNLEKLLNPCQHVLKGTTFRASINGPPPDVYYNKQWQLRGVLLNFLKLSARKFEFDLKLIRGLMHGQLNTKTGKWSGLHKMLRNNEIDTIMAPLYFLEYQYFDFGMRYTIMNVKFCSRKNFPAFTLYNIIRPFKWKVWTLLLVSLLLFGLTFAIVYKTYAAIPERVGKLGPFHSTPDFFIRALTSFTEPDSLKWFPEFSIGKILTLIWMFYCTFMVYFYLSNLRANLINTNYQPNINMVQDVLDHVVNLYSMDVAGRLLPKNLPLVKKVVDSASYDEMEKYVMKIERTPGGIYDLSKYNGILPPNVPYEIFHQRAAFTCTDPVYEEAYRQDKELLNTKVLHMSDYVLYGVTSGQLLRKYSTYSHDFALFGLRLHDMGFYEYYVYQETPLPFTRYYRASLNVKENEMKPLTVNNYIIPIVFLVSGFLVSILVLLNENMKKK